MIGNKGQDGQDSRIEWVEPEMTELNVTATARLPRFGRDGGPYADCLRS